MNKIMIHIDEPSFERSKSDQVTGVIYFDLEDRQFPEKSWNDFVVVILNWWLSEIANLTSGKVDVVELLFMDGPFLLRVRKRTNLLCFVECVKQTDPQGTKYAYMVSTHDLSGNLLDVATRVKSVCSQHAWENREIDELDRRIGDLQKLAGMLV